MGESYFFVRKLRAKASTEHVSLHVAAGHPADVPFSFGREPKRLTFAVAASAVAGYIIEARSVSS